MTRWDDVTNVDRRTFVTGIAGLAGAFAVGGCRSVPASTSSSAVASRSPAAWSDRMGLQLFTVRDQIDRDFEGTLAAVAAAGYKEVEPTSYSNLTPAQVRGALDRAGLAAPSTHVALTQGPDLERQLAGYQQMGHRWAMARAGGGGGAGRGGGRGGPPSPQTVDSVKRQADLYNQIGAAGRQYGVRVLIHNHTGEFEPFADSPMTPYDVLFTNTDPALVAFELDIGWATVAGQNVLALFAKHPHRFPLWHVKDMAGLAALTSMTTQGERQRAAKIVPVGLGEINYRPIFDHAADAGLEHYYIEQDTAPDTGSLDAMRLSAQNLRRSLG